MGICNIKNFSAAEPPDSQRGNGEGRKGREGMTGRKGKDGGRKEEEWRTHINLATD